MKKKNLKFAVIGIMVLLIASLAFFVISNNSKTPKAVEEQPHDSNYFESLDNCRCFEKEKFSCPKGFEIIDKMCRNETEKTFTNFLKTCSAYECFGSVVSWNGSEWSPKLNIGNEE